MNLLLIDSQNIFAILESNDRAHVLKKEGRVMSFDSLSNYSFLFSLNERAFFQHP